MTVEQLRGQIAFSEEVDLASGGGPTVLAKLFDATGPYVSSTLHAGRVVLDEVFIDSISTGIVTLAFIDVFLNVQIVRKVGPGDVWSASRMQFGSTWTTQVSLWAALDSVGASTARVRASGRVV